MLNNSRIITNCLFLLQMQSVLSKSYMGVKIFHLIHLGNADTDVRAVCKISRERKLSKLSAFECLKIDASEHLGCPAKPSTLRL